MKHKILVTGSTGYIGSHTIISLLENNYDVVSVDNFSKSEPFILDCIKKIRPDKFNHYTVDLTDSEALKNIFFVEKNITGIIHFAAFKAVGESVEHPLKYYHNNLVGLLNLLECCKNHQIKHFIFSSSCTIYGNPVSMPVVEDSPIAPPMSPYGATKQMGEQIIKDFNLAYGGHHILLRYFNPVGAHPSNFLGECSRDLPQNLMPVITETAIGKRSKMYVFGNDYSTPDGTCIRDYIHVCDIADAHTLSMNYCLQLPQNMSLLKVFNLGSGQGYSVLEIIKKFEKITNLKLQYEISQRRSGDVPAIFANNELAIQELGWQPQYNIEAMIETAWNWEVARKKMTN
ncbi:MAG: UDP-glucose 4-epimerase GalE [Sediminibacterium sp.]|nr:UDP-glucose 4-epimerase GalE [Sediminibacterium sp.]